MLKIIANEFEWMFNNTSTIKALYNYFVDNSFRVQCKIRHIQRIKNPLLKMIAINRLEKQYTFKLGTECLIGDRLFVHHYNGVVIGEQAQIGHQCEIYQQVTIGSKNHKYPKIGDHVILYPGCKVIGDIYIGDNAIIAPNSVVIKDVPSNAIVSGVPAQIIKMR